MTVLSRIKTAVLGAYVTAIVVAFLWVPLVTLHGYRQWWVVLFYATFATAVIGGSISHYAARRRA